MVFGKPMSDKTPSRANVCTEVVAHDLCIGCGLCAGVCPNEHLRVAFNAFGEYVAFENPNECAASCDLCLRVCPFSPTSKDEDVLGKKCFEDVPGMSHASETGYYLRTVLGYSAADGHRANGASGGLLTWTLETLLARGLVDRVACVSPVREADRAMKFTMCSTAEEVRAASRSAYYPVEISEMIRTMLSRPGRYVITVLPCFAKAIRQAMEAVPRLRERVAFVLGLACGGGKSKFYAEYICAMGGGDAHRLDRVTFRIKDPERPASDHGTRCVSAAGTPEEHACTVFGSEGPGLAWAHLYFTPIACSFCDDGFAELADGTFMDAWRPGFMEDPGGHSIVILRNQTLSDLFRDGMASGALAMRDVDIAEAIASQPSMLHFKRTLIRERVRLAAEMGQRVPPKRPHRFAPRVRHLEKAVVRARWDTCRQSRKQWVEADKDLARFRRAMAPCAARVERAMQISKTVYHPQAIPGALWRRLRNLVKR